MRDQARTGTRVGTLAALVLLVVASAAASRRCSGAASARFGFGGPRVRLQAAPERALRRPLHVRARQLRTAPGGYWWRGQPSWSHGYPIAEQNLMRIMNEVSYLGAHDDEINTLTLDDPELFKYPVAYIIEVSWWTLTDAQAAALRAYMQKGGFVIVDDFKAYGDFGSPGWEVFEQNMRRVLPDARFFDDERRRIRSSTRSSRSTTSTSSRRPTTPGSRSSAASTRTTIRRSA